MIIILVAAVLVTIIAVGIYSYMIEPRWLRVRRRVVHLDNWSTALSGLTLLHLSDLHLRSRASPVDTFLQRSVGVDADLLLFTGDYIAEPAALGRAVTVLRMTLAGRTAYGVLGNHEHAVYGFGLPLKRKFNTKRQLDSEQVAGRLARSGLVLLRNTSVALTYNGATFTLAAVDDRFNGFEDLPSAVAGLKDTDDTILLSHSPDIHAQAAELGIPLVLAGHTHGGQVRLPPFGTPTTATHFPLDRPSGILRKGTSRMHISPGLGLSWPPVRFFARPEITVLELRSREHRSP